MKLACYSTTTTDEAEFRARITMSAKGTPEVTVNKSVKNIKEEVMKKSRIELQTSRQ